MVEQQKPHLEVVAPVFWVTDIARSRAYFVEQLGFEVQFEWADDDEGQPRYLVLRNGNTELHVNQVEDSRPSIAYFFVNGIQDYYDAVNSTDAIITEHIRDFPWGMREFEVQDPDGNKLIFGQRQSRVEGDSEA